MYKNTTKRKEKIKEQHNALKAHHHHKQLYKNQTSWKTYIHTGQR